MRLLETLVVSTLLLGCSRDEEARSVLSDMEKLQTEVSTAMQQSPSEAGVAAAEAAVAKAAPGLRARMTSLRGAKLSPATLSGMPTRCALNDAAASSGAAFVKQGLHARNAPLEERDRLNARLDKLKTEMRDLCK